MESRKKGFKNVGDFYGRNGFKSFVIYGFMCIGVGLRSSNHTCINSLECVCSNTNQDNKRRVKEKVKLGVAFATLLCYYVSVNKVCNR